MSPPPAIAADAGAPALPVAAPSLRIAVPKPDATLVGILMIVASTLVFSIGDVFAKFMSDTMSGYQVTWFRFLVFAATVPLIAIALRGPGVLRTRHPGLQILRGVAVCGGSTFFLVGLTMLPLAENTAIAFMGPLFVTALSVPLLKEKVGIRRWMAALVGFGGVLLIVRPGTDAFQLAALLPAASALVGAFGTLFVRMMPNELPETTLTWTGLTAFLLLSLVMPFVWVTPTTEEIGWGLATGILSAIGHALVVLAFRRANASVLAPFSYVQLLFAGVFAWLAFGAVPGVWTILGILVIAASGLYTAHRERVRGVAAR